MCVCVRPELEAYFLVVGGFLETLPSVEGVQRVLASCCDVLCSDCISKPALRLRMWVLGTLRASVWSFLFLCRVHWCAKSRVALVSCRVYLTLGSPAWALCLTSSATASPSSRSSPE